VTKKLQLSANIGSSSSVMNKARLLVLIFNDETKPYDGLRVDDLRMSPQLKALLVACNIINVLL
jgi:hypothetical protein